MRVLAIVPCPHIYGMQIMTLRLFERLSKNIESHFVLTRWSDGEFARRLQLLKIPYSETWFGMFSRKLDRKNLQMTIGCIEKLPTSYRDVARTIRSWHPDVIYMCNYHELILLWPLLAWLRVPVVCHVHNMLPTNGFYRCSARIWGSNVTHYVAVSKSVCTTIRTMGVRAERISVIYNGVDLFRFPYRENRSLEFVQRFGWPVDSVVVGMTGQMNEIKGHHEFIEAAKMIHLQDANVRFVIGGKEGGAYYDELCRKISVYGLDSVIGFSGWQEDMAQFYAGLDIFVLPSKTEEGFGLVLAEAMAVGIPVISTQCGGGAEVVQEGVTGLIVEKGRADLLAKAVDRLLNSIEERRTFGKSGRAKVVSSFNLDCQSEQFESVFRRISPDVA